jgi:nitric oxide reductase NorD protein
VEELQRVLIDPKEQEQKVLQHTFEKVETAENFDGAVRDDDGADELEDHADALKELELKQLIRGGQQAHSIYKADIRIDADIPDVGTISPDERGIPYDEWNGAAKSWKRQWCTVYPSMVPQQDPAWVAAALLRHHALIQRLRRQLESHRSGRLMAYRQLEGEEVDLDAVVQHQASVAAGHSGAARLYQRAERHRRDFATLVLMDVSLSADAWVANRRVLDVARESVLVLGEVAALLGDNLTVQAFASNTRNCCRVWHVHGPQENWKQSRGRLGVLEPQGYTRMGPALRHATATLAAQSVSRKLLILISDGKPNDYDRYEGRYGVSDVRMALHEAQQQGIHTHALAIDAVARDYLPTMLGPGAWSVLLSPNQLPERLSSVYGRLTA